MHRPPCFAASSALILVLASGTGVGAPPAARADRAAQEPSVAERVRDLLRRPSVDSAGLVDALVALGPTAIRAVVDALRDEAVPAGDAERVTRLAPATLRVLHTVLSRFDREAVVASLRDRIVLSQEAPDRRVALEVLGEIGRAEELELLCEAATPPADGGFDSRTGAVAQRALEQLFARDPAALEFAAKRLASAHAEVAPALARAIGSSASPASFDLLAGSLGLRPDLDLVLLSNLARAEGRYSSPQRSRALECVRARLSDPDPLLARTAATVCGELGDTLSAPILCGLLERSDAQLAAAAHRSLSQLSGLDFSAQRERWRPWLDAEEAWLQAEAELVLEQLRSPDEALVLQALRTVALHPLHRETLAPRVAEVATGGARGMRALACTVLGRLGWPGSLPALRELARAAAPEVARAADAAFRSIRAAVAGPR